MTKSESYKNWSAMDASKHGVLQESAFSAGWDAATKRCIDILKTTYIIDDGEDYAQLVLDRINEDS